MMGTEGLTGALPQVSPAGVLAPPDTLPPLENSDRLSCGDFEQHYEAITYAGAWTFRLRKTSGTRGGSDAAVNKQHLENVRRKGALPRR